MSRSRVRTWFRRVPLIILAIAALSCGDRESLHKAGWLNQAGTASQVPGAEVPRSGLTRLITDSRGVQVKVPIDPRRVATVSDGLVEEVMIALGIQDRIVGIGSTCLTRVFEYEYALQENRTLVHRGGMNPARYLFPELAEIPLFVRPGTEINFETLAGLRPDLLILDLGCCTLPWRHDERAMDRGLERLESLGIPTVVLAGPNSGGQPGIESLSSVIHVLGDVFGRQDETRRIGNYLEESVRRVFERTRTIPDHSRRSVLLLGLNPNVRGGSGIGQVSGTDDIQSYFVEEVVHGRNAYRGANTAILNLEQVLSADPDVIILPTANGYHPPQELLDGHGFEDLQGLRAVRDQRVASLPWSPCNCDKRLEYPIDVYVIATAVYPERFEDIDLASWILDFYRTVYGVDDRAAMGLLSAQWLAWTLN